MARKGSTKSPDEKQAAKDKAVVTYWLNKLKDEEKVHAKWREQAKAAECAYYDTDDKKKALFPLFKADVDNLLARVYSNTPSPDVRKRNKVGNIKEPVDFKPIALAMERSLEFMLDDESGDFDGNAQRIVLDRLIAGAGIPFIEYDAQVDLKQDDDSGEILDGSIDLQRVRLVQKSYKRFHWEPSQCWRDCEWIALDDYLSKQEIKAQFGRKVEGEGISAEDVQQSTGEKEHTETKWRVTTFWSRRNRRIYKIGHGFDSPLAVEEDKLQLRGFYPCPAPLFANLKSDVYTPKPDFAFWEEMYAFLNRLTSRINKLTAQLRDVGVYDSKFNSQADGAPLDKASTAEDGTWIPVSNLAERLSTAGGALRLDQVLAKLPIAEKAQVLQILIEMRKTTKAELQELTGSSDIVRGHTDPRETKGAQQYKAQYANLRLSVLSGSVQRMVRNVFRIMCEIIAEHFTPEQIYLMTGIQLSPQQMEVLRSDVGRSLSIDVETESTVAADDESEKAQRLEMVKVVGDTLRVIGPAMLQGQMPATLGKQLLLTAAQSFKYGRDLEDELEALPENGQQLMQLSQSLQQTQQQLQQCQQQLQKAQQDLATVDQREQAREDFKAQSDAQAKQAEGAKDGTTAQLNQARTAATVRQLFQPPQQPGPPGGIRE